MTAIEKMYWFLSTQLGFDPRATWRTLRSLPRFVSDWLRFRANYKGRLELLPCLQDWHAPSGAIKAEYFWQDLLVARMIFEAKPDKHVDIGSSVEGFVAHVASFREVEVFDVRPSAVHIPGVTFVRADLMQPLAQRHGTCDSVSCLHALEHFGLGRYGDPIDPRGFERGLTNIANLLKANGVFYLSIPIGIERVEFNGQRVLDPRHVASLAAERGLDLRSLTVIRTGGKIESAAIDEARLAELARQRYALGIFVFRKRAQ